MESAVQRWKVENAVGGGEYGCGRTRLRDDDGWDAQRIDEGRRGRMELDGAEEMGVQEGRMACEVGGSWRVRWLEEFAVDGGGGGWGEARGRCRGGGR